MYWYPLQVKARGFLATGAMIVKKESPLGLYKGMSMLFSDSRGRKKEAKIRLLGQCNFRYHCYYQI